MSNPYFMANITIGGDKDATEVLSLLQQYEQLRRQYHMCCAIEEALHVPMHQQQQHRR